MTSSSPSTTMPGVVFEKPGDSSVFQYRTDLPVPTLKEGEVLVKNDYVGVNYIDIYLRSGLYPAALPSITGQEASGTVVTSHSSGTTPSFSPGDRVAYLHTSTYAAYTAVPAAKLIKLPGSVTTQTAAAVMLQGLTALTLIREAAGIAASKVGVRKGENQSATGPWTLVHAAAGGTGLVLVQLLAASGARVIAAASSEEKCALAREAGAGWSVIVERDAGGANAAWVAKVKEITGGHGVDAIFDGVGKSTFAGSMAAIARKGTMVSFGNSSGGVPPIDIRLTLASKNVKLLRPQVFNYLVTREELEGFAGELLGYVEKGVLDVKVHKVYDLKDVARAHDDLASRGTMGKLVLKVE